MGSSWCVGVVSNLQLWALGCSLQHVGVASSMGRGSNTGGVWSLKYGQFPTRGRGLQHTAVVTDWGVASTREALSLAWAWPPTKGCGLYNRRGSQWVVPGVWAWSLIG